MKNLYISFFSIQATKYVPHNFEYFITLNVIEIGMNDEVFNVVSQFKGHIQSNVTDIRYLLLAVEQGRPTVLIKGHNIYYKLVRAPHLHKSQ
jgi:hypothetical protein